MQRTRPLSRDDLRANERRHSRDARVRKSEKIEEIASLELGSNRLFKAQVPSHQIRFRSKGEKKSEGKAHDFLAPRDESAACERSLFQRVTNPRLESTLFLNANPDRYHIA